jgi:hypothetical protein
MESEIQTCHYWFVLLQLIMMMLIRRFDIVIIPNIPAIFSRSGRTTHFPKMCQTESFWVTRHEDQNSFSGSLFHAWKEGRYRSSTELYCQTECLQGNAGLSDLVFWPHSPWWQPLKGRWMWLRYQGWSERGRLLRATCPSTILSWWWLPQPEGVHSFLGDQKSSERDCNRMTHRTIGFRFLAWTTTFIDRCHVGREGRRCSATKSSKSLRHSSYYPLRNLAGR